MIRHARPLAALGLAAFLSAWALNRTGTSLPAATAPIQAAAASSLDFGAYRLAKLTYLQNVLYQVGESYVEPQRIDAERMFDSALREVELRVPACRFQREPGGEVLHVEVGDHTEVLEIPPLTDTHHLAEALTQVALVLEEHLDPADVPHPQEADRPFVDVEYAMTNGVLATLDPHTMLLPPDAARMMEEENEGEFGGLGINVSARQDGRLVIERVTPGTPARRQGLRQTDVILRIDGVSTLNMPMDSAVELLRGPVGSTVSLELKRAGEEQVVHLVVTRENIPFHPVRGELVDGGIAWITVPSFHVKVADQVEQQLMRLTREAPRGELEGVILDLRDNPGGYLNQAVRIADLFLDKGVITATVERDPTRRTQNEAQAAGTQPLYPLVVLVNANSASASEIVSGALRNHGRAVVVGERTFGKGSVQNLKDLDSDPPIKLKLTVAQYLTPGDRSIQGVGIPADVELVPTHVYESGEGLVASRFARDRVLREADLDHALHHDSSRYEEPAYSLRYLDDERVRQAVLARGDEPGIEEDLPARFARDLLLSSTSWRRGEILASAGPVVSRYTLDGGDQIEAALTSLGLDWSAGPVVDAAPLQVSMSVGEGEALIAGRHNPVTLTVTNPGDRPVHRLVVVAESDNPFLDQREFFVGRLPPGETRTATQVVELPLGYPAEAAPLALSFRTGDGTEVARDERLVRTVAADPAALSWSLSLADAGDGDGVVDEDEAFELRWTVTNTGAGPTGPLQLSVINHAGASVDIEQGTLYPGALRLADGTSCEEESTRCQRSLLPGESAEGLLRGHVNRRVGRGPLPLELNVKDPLGYDWATVWRGGFHDLASVRERLTLEVGEPYPTLGERQPPKVVVSRSTPLTTDQELVTLSGSVADISALQHVQVFVGEDKVFYAAAPGKAQVATLPWTADVRLEPGLNTLYVIATDASGLTSSRAFSVLREDPELTAQLKP